MDEICTSKPSLGEKRILCNADVNRTHIFFLVIADMMAGVGPFAVPLAMSNSNKSSSDRKVIVYANGLYLITISYSKSPNL